MGRRRSLSTAATLLALLTAPAAAQAATYTVQAGGGTCGGGDLTCEGMAEAASAAAAGDVFNVAQGIYGSATFSVGGVTIAGAPAFTVNGTLGFSADTGGVSKVQKAAINQNVGAGNGILVTGKAGAEISDSVIISNNGDGVVFAEGTANKIMRSVIATGGTGTAAVRVISADNSADAKALTMESTLVTGSAAGLSVNTGGDGLGTPVGGVTVRLRHVTAAGSTNGLVLDSHKAEGPLLGSGVGSIVAEVADSIIQNGTAKDFYPGVPLLFAANTITDTYTRTLRAFDPNAVFVDAAARKYRLKAGSPAINAGGVTPGESPTDIDGQDRSTAPTDQGADEYVPTPPPTTPLTPPAVTPRNDGTPPAVVITRPRANQRVRLFRKRTRTVTVTRNGERVRVRRTTRTRARISFAGTAKDPAGIKGVVVTVQKLSSTPARSSRSATTTTTKCRWLNATKGMVLKSCAKPPLLVARVAKDGAWVFNVRRSIRLGAGRYRIIAVGLDNSGSFGNSAPARDAVHRFTLVR